MGRKRVADMTPEERERNRERRRKEAQSPEAKARIRARAQSPDAKEKRRAYLAEYQQRPDVRERDREHDRRPEAKERARQRKQRPDVKERNREFMREYARRPDIAERRRVAAQEKGKLRRPEIEDRARLRRLAAKRRDREYMREYRQRADFKERRRARRQLPEVKNREREYMLEYRRRTDVETRLLEYKQQPYVVAREQELRLRRLCGIGLFERDRMMCEQGGKCAICSREIALGGATGANVDHCHRTGFARGILCHHCNKGLGRFLDCKGSLINATHYITRGRTEHKYEKAGTAVGRKLRATLLAAQGGRCAICTDETAFGGAAGANLDHCHVSGYVRGILCSGCNSGLGHFFECRGNLVAAAHYLERAYRAYLASQNGEPTCTQGIVYAILAA